MKKHEHKTDNREWKVKIDKEEWKGKIMFTQEQEVENERKLHGWKVR